MEKFKDGTDKTSIKYRYEVVVVDKNQKDSRDSGVKVDRLNLILNVSTSL